MYKLTHVISSKLIAKEVCLEQFGKNIDISNISAFSKADPKSLTFSTRPSKTSKSKGLVVSSVANNSHSGLISTNPRLDFIYILNWLIDRGMIESEDSSIIHKNAKIHSSAIIGENVSIGLNSIIGPNCNIQNGSVLGENVIVGSNTIIGCDGFGYEKDKGGCNIKFPHLGGVVVNNNVEVGNLCSIARGTLDNTIINEGVKIDNHVYIAHNVLVGKNSMLMSGSKVNGSVKIGKNCWIGTGAMIREGVSVSDNTIVGMGSVVVKNINEESTVVGNPARQVEG